jgi:hypothetical protein
VPTAARGTARRQPGPSADRSAVIPTRSRNPGTSTHSGIEPDLRSAASAPKITKFFLLAKLFRPHSMNFLRQEKNIRDHGDELVSSV